MLNYIVKHSRQGFGKITDVDNRTFKVRFVSGEELAFSKNSFSDGSIQHCKLRLKFRCASERGFCVVQRILNQNKNGAPFEYEVLYEDGLSAAVSELALTPLPQEPSTELHDQLGNLEIQSYNIFRARESLLYAYAGLLREGRGLRALLSSRIDLRPHQAYVAGVVLLDNVRRYLLADEVGLGKTIEAGIIIHDLLAQKSDAKILILCPSALTQQWFCEIYSKFSGQIFTLLDLYAGQAINLEKLNKTICSITHAAYDRADIIRSIRWDLIVVDEAHHLLSSSVLYDFVQKISAQARSLLLLSAIPATRREDEFLRLLALLEPTRYRSFSNEAQQKFRLLYDAQSQIGKYLRLASRRIEGIGSDDFKTDDVMKVFSRLLEVEVLSEDEKLINAISLLENDSKNFAEKAKDIVRDVADRFRLNRRILRNRRQHLIEEGQIQPIQRVFRPQEYTPEQLEIETMQSVEEIIQSLLIKKEKASTKEKAELEILIPALYRVIVQSLVLPQTALTFFERLAKTRGQMLNEQGRDFVGMSHVFGYEDWDFLANLLCIAARQYVSDEIIERAVHRARAWQESADSFTRFQLLVEFLHRKHKQNPHSKFIVFAGFPEAAEILTDLLRAEFGEKFVKDFLFDSTAEEKEKGILDFQKNPEIWLLVSDETGGEGRNFQFVNELVHFDNSWFASRTEQRIGRLDRLGREKTSTEVISNVFYAAGSTEAGLINCYQNGFKIYERSVSGLEFALRETEERIVNIAVEDGFDGLIAFVPELADIAEHERAQDESETVLDEASYEFQAAQKYLQISHQADNEKNLQKHFVEYFQMLSTPNSARETRDAHFSSGIWKFKLDNINAGQFLLKNEQGGTLNEVKGTFNREIAQQSPSINFINVGNELFDSVINSLSNTNVGRVYAVACRSSEIDSWRGFEFSFFAAPNLELLGNEPTLISKAAAYFPLKPLHLFLKLDGKYDSETNRMLRRIRRSLTPAQKNQTWWNLTNEKTAYLPQLIGEQDWQEITDKIYDKARRMAQNYYEKTLKENLQTEIDHFQEQIRRTDFISGEFAVESASLQLLSEAIENWQVVTDTAGFLAVNTPGLNLK